MKTSDPTKYELLLAEEEGRIAFGQGKKIEFNPYQKHNLRLATAWQDGWNAAQKDHLIKPPHKSRQILGWYSGQNICDSFIKSGYCL